MGLLLGRRLPLPEIEVGLLAVDGQATPEQIALVLPVTGTVDQTATATIRYRLSPSGDWNTGHPLFRVQPGESTTPAVGSVDDVFAWSIIDLAPGTAYDVEVTVTEGADTDVQTITATTRSLPPVAGVATDTISAGASSATIQTAINGLSAGDVLEFENGSYTVDGLLLAVSGAEGNPIYIRGESRDGVTLTDTDGRIIEWREANYVVLENMTLQGSGVDGGASTFHWGIFGPDAYSPTQGTIRNVTINGVNQGIVFDSDATQFLVYDNTLNGNNLWNTTFVDSNITWNDDGIRIPGGSHAIFNNTLDGFGDSLSYAGHTGGSTANNANSIHFYRNDVRNSGDDFIEVDHANRNCTAYDNRVHNAMTFSSLDPLYGGPLLYARNIGINIGRTSHKWNDQNTGHFLYNNTVVMTETSGGVSAWYQPNNGPQDYYGYRNNLLIDRGNQINELPWIESTGHSNLDFNNNAWYPDKGVQWGPVFASIAAANSGLAATTPVFGGETQRFANDVVTVSDPFVSPITLGADYLTEVTDTYTPTLGAGETPNNAGVAVVNVTDGFSGAAPDIGAIIEGRQIPTYGDRQNLPAYISSLSDYEVRALSGSYAPTNGTSDIQSVTPSEWLTSDPGGGLGSVISAWSGGFKAIQGAKMFVHGGGHNDSANNGVYVFDFAGGSRPTGWTLPSISAVADVVAASNTYADGRTTSVHTYDGTVYAHHNNTIYRFTGAHYNPGGGFQSGAIKYDIDLDTWTEVQSFPGTLSTVSTIYDAESKKILVGMGGQFQAAFFDTSDDTFSSMKSTGAGFWGGDVCGAYDTSRGRGVLVGNGESRLVTIDWGAETVTVSTLSATGSTSILSDSAPSCFYDEARDSYWIFGGPTAGSGWTTLYEMDAGSLDIVTHPLIGDSITRISGMIGSYGRFVFLKPWRAIGVIADIDTPAYVIKLP